MGEGSSGAFYTIYPTRVLTHTNLLENTFQIKFWNVDFKDVDHTCCTSNHTSKPIKSIRESHPVATNCHTCPSNRGFAISVMRTTYYYVSLPKLLPFGALWPSEGVGLIERSTESFSRTCRVPPRVRSSRASSEREGPGFQKVGCDCFLERLLPRKGVEIRATLHTWDWEPVTIALHALSLVKKAEPVQVRFFTLRLRDQRSMWVNARWMWSLQAFLRGIEWIMFHGHLDYFKKSSLGG